MCGEGHSGSATQRPGRTSYIGLGGTESCIQTRSIGSSMTPFSAPLSQWSNQRTASCRKPMLGPGSASSGNACAQGPISPLRGTDRPSRSRGTAFVYPSTNPPTAYTGHSMAE